MSAIPMNSIVEDLQSLLAAASRPRPILARGLARLFDGHQRADRDFGEEFSGRFLWQPNAAVRCRLVRRGAASQKDLCASPLACLGGDVQRNHTVTLCGAIPVGPRIEQGAHAIFPAKTR